MSFFARLLAFSTLLGSLYALNLRQFESQVNQFVSDSSDGMKHWAVLVAGSNTYSNYRHQADICHAYQILHNNGIPDEQIVVMMYDDIADSRSNPKKGTIINHPDGDDVYAGVPKDYTGNDVTAQNFLDILTGADMSGRGSGKTLASTGDDKVFIYYADHGATGLVAMPTGSYLYATDLNKALNTMHTNNMYKELVFYLEACESGSMFQDLDTSINIYATTASSASESSYACYYVSELNTYVGDCYSVAWMEDTDAADITAETLQSQYDTVKKVTTESHVLQFGDLNIDTEVLQEFQSNSGSSITNKKINTVNFVPTDKRQALSSRDVNLKYLAGLVSRAETQAEFDEATELLMKEVSHRKFSDSVFSQLKTHFTSITASNNIQLATNSNEFDTCFKTAIEGVENTCGKFTDYSLKHAQVLHGACVAGVSSNTIVEVADRFCSAQRSDIM
jgi:legumain